MSEPRLISPILDDFAIGGPISDHHGIRCYPAMKNESDDRYIVKIISIPQSQTQLDALLLTGVYPDTESAMTYFKELTDEVINEVEILNRLSQLEGFLPFEDCQVVDMEEDSGYEVYLLGTYKRTLEKQFWRAPLTHLGALNLGLDLCAALTTCRRSGYLYAALKPSNIFVTAEQEFRIGDLGFLRLDSLKYTSLPDKYRSVYTPPEISDAYSTVNTTLDTYAVGLILYQAYNNGELPEITDPQEPFPAPAYADYEMAEIILKACDPNPENRWEDPAQLGQALVNYMQRNGANDTPIVPPAAPVIPEEIPEEPQQDSPDDALATEEVPATEADTGTSIDDSMEQTVDEEITESEDNLEDLNFLPDEEELEVEEDEISYDEVSGEVTEILEQADDLASHPVPDPVVAPEPVEVTLPKPEPEPEEEPETQSEEITGDNEDPAEDTDEEMPEKATAPEVEEESQEDESDSPAPRKHSKRWVWISGLAVLVAGLLVAGFFFVKNYYLVQIRDITLSGSEDTLTVQVDTDIDESILLVVCTDSHGNQFTAPVSDGKAVITGLVPDTGYNVKVIVSGFHRVTGEASTAYSTPAQTNIIQFNAVMGSEEGSVFLSFNIDGPDSDQWNIRYSTEGMEPVTVSFPSHIFTINGLTLGKEYTFTLAPASPLFVTGIEEIKFTPTALVLAENLRVDSCVNNTLTASWAAPANTDVKSWTVRCYNESRSYDQTQVVEEARAVFKDLDHNDAYTVEVTAANMSVNQWICVEKNAVTLSNLKADDSKPNQLTLTWDATRTSSEGWLVSYTADGSEPQLIPCPKNTVTISPVVPGAKYTVTIKDAKGSQVLGGIYDHTAKDASEFTCTYDGYTVSASNMTFSMCRTPDYSNWNRYYLSSSDYTTKFKVGEKASFLVKLNKSYGTSSDTIVTLFAIRDASGKLVSTATQSQSWTKMWSNGYCELDIPALPDKAGKYSVSVYFNGALAATQDFTMQ